MIKDDKICQQNLATSSSLTQLTGDSLFHENQQNETFIHDDSNISRDIADHTSQPTKPNFTTTPASIWTRKTEKVALKSYKTQKSRISPSKSSCLKFGADARDIQHFKTFGSSSDRNACTPQKDSEKQTIMTNSDQKNVGDNNKSLPFYDGTFSCRSKASFLQESGNPTNSKAKKKITNINLIPAAPIASSEELSPMPDEVRYKKARKPNLKIKPISMPSPPAYTQFNLNSEELMNKSADYVSPPSKSKKHFVFIPMSQKSPETEAHLSKRKDKLNCSPISKYNLSIPPSPASLNNNTNSSVFQLEVPANPQVTFV